MVRAGISYEQLHFINGNLNAQIPIPRLILMPFICRHHLMFQHHNARPHVIRNRTQFWKAENVPVLCGTAYAPDRSPVEQVWDALDRRVRQCVPVPVQYPAFPTAIEMEWTTFHRPKSTVGSTLCEGDVLRCIRANGGHTRY